MDKATHNRQSGINSGINVTPMVDVMLVLLIIFMVVTPMLKPGIPVQLPRTTNPRAMPDADRTDALIVAVSHDGTIFLGNDMVSAELLPQKIKDRLALRSDKTVYVRADSRVRYKFLVNVVDGLRMAGVNQLGLLTEQTRSRHVTAEPGT